MDTSDQDSFKAISKYKTTNYTTVGIPSNGLAAIPNETSIKFIGRLLTESIN
jgi:hypothetical protein